ncbi:MAG: amino acid adenylation domain-containing protein, partial [Bacteroidota bacterium]
MEDLINRLRENDVHVEVVNDELQLNVPVGADLNKLLLEVKDSKQALITYIKKIRDNAVFQKIQPAPIKKYYPLSSAQKRLYFLYRLDEESRAYNMPQVIKLKEKPDQERLEAVFTKLIYRHESLRTSFEEVNGVPVQKIAEVVDFKLESYESSKEGWTSIVREFIRPFDLKAGPLLRAGLITVFDRTNKSAIAEYFLILDMHHIIADGVSQSVLVNDFMSLHKGEEILDLPLQYKDYVEWQLSESQQKQIVKQKSFWLKEFSQPTLPLELPTDYNRPREKSFKGRSYEFKLTKEDAVKLRNITDQTGTTMYMVLFSAYVILLSKLGNQEDIVVGTPAAGRQHMDLEGIIGMFVNTLPVRSYPDGNKSFKEFLSEVKDNILACFENQEYPYEQLLDVLNLKRHVSRNPLFDMVFSYQNFSKHGDDIADIEHISIERGQNISKFDLTMTASEYEDQIHLNVEYSTDLFKRSTINRFALYFKKLVTAITLNHDIRLKDIDILSSRERYQLLTTFNDTLVDYPKDKTIIELFHEQVKKNAAKIAIEFDNEMMTYQTLDLLSRKVASYLHQINDVRPEECIGVLADWSGELVAVFLGILKAGGAYLPLDPGHPVERIRQMVQDAQVRIVLAPPKYHHLLTDNMVIVTPESLFRERPQKEFRNTAGPDSLAYVMYTSGSAGTPKGVAVTHRNVVRLVKNTNYIELNESTRILQTGTQVFDAATFEIWGSLLNGGALVLKEKEAFLHSRSLAKVLSESKINTLWLTSGLFNQHAKEVPTMFCGLHYLLVGGDVLNPVAINHVRNTNPNLKILNAYGPTENTTFSTFHVIDRDYNDSIPIGKPISNSRAYVLSNYGQLQPIGVAGELYVGGDGVSRGYINQSTLTAENFVPDPFHSGGRLYRTGDLARWSSDGALQFLGRQDDQVKIRGFRIELGEIEHKLANHDQLRDVIVMSREFEGEKHLAAYYVSEKPINADAIRSYLQDKLPDYMLPEYYVHLDQFPLTLNGKVDKKALPAPEIQAGKDYEPAATELEHKLVAIWSEVLKLPPEVISVTKSFFELGGHSLRATVMVNRIFSTLSIEAPLKEVFGHQDIRSLANYIGAKESSVYFTIEPSVSKSHYSLSSSQKRLYFLYQFDRDSLAYNMPQVVKLEGKLDRARLQAA